LNEKIETYLQESDVKSVATVGLYISWYWYSTRKEFLYINIRHIFNGKIKNVMLVIEFC